jgi:hypothetical protein
MAAALQCRFHKHFRNFPACQESGETAYRAYVCLFDSQSSRRLAARGRSVGRRRERKKGSFPDCTRDVMELGFKPRARLSKPAQRRKSSTTKNP